MEGCIYYKEREGLHFTKEEHIIPAGIGGIKTLKVGVVSDEFNNDFSNLEEKFMRNSLISIPREFHGPGKRGSLSVSKATKSRIHIQFEHENENKAHLGYLKLGMPYTINQLKIEDNKLNFSLPPDLDDIDKLIERFRLQLCEYKFQHIEILEKRLPVKTILLGFHDNKWFLGRNEETSIENLPTVVKSLLKELTERTATIDYEHAQHQVTCHQTASIHIIDTFRVYAKIAFNCLTYFTNTDFVLREEFDEVRNWIAEGGKNKFTSFFSSASSEELSFLPFPKNSHRIIISKVDLCLFAIVGLYGGSFTETIKLSTNFRDKFDLKMFICDWQNKREYNLFEFLQQLNSSEKFD